MVAGRVSGVIGCVVVAIYVWWLGLGLLVMWFVVRRIVLTRGHPPGDRAARPGHRDAPGLVLHLGRLAGPRREGGSRVRPRRLLRRPLPRRLPGLDPGRRRPGCARCTGGPPAAGWSCSPRWPARWPSIADDVHNHSIGVRTLAIVLPMVAVTMSVGSDLLRRHHPGLDAGRDPRHRPARGRARPVARASCAGARRHRPGASANRCASSDVRFRYPAGAIGRARRPRPRAARRHVDRDRRRQRRRQVDPGQPDLAAARPDRRPRSPSTASTSATSIPRQWQRASRSCRRSRPATRSRLRQHRVRRDRARRRPRRRRGGRPAVGLRRRRRDPARRLADGPLARAARRRRALRRPVAAPRPGPGAVRHPARRPAADPRRADRRAGRAQRGRVLRPLPRDHRTA